MNKNSYPETIILVDASFLEFITTDFKKNFSRMLGRELPNADIAEMLSCIALDGGVKPNGKNKIGVIFIYDKSSATLSSCNPSSLPSELNGVAFSDNVGEFSLEAHSTEGFTTVEEMFLDVLQAFAESKDIKRLLVVGYNEHYGDKIEEVLEKAANKETVQFRMDECKKEKPRFKTQIVAYPIMKSFGIRSEELA